MNGLFDKHGISSVVVVGGVGDWLDVPNAVIRLEKYVASDALEKAKSSKLLQCAFNSIIWILRKDVPFILMYALVVLFILSIYLNSKPPIFLWTRSIWW